MKKICRLAINELNEDQNICKKLSQKNLTKNRSKNKKERS